MIGIVLLVIGISIASGCLYRMGGTSLGTKWRDIGCPLCVCALIWLLGGITSLMAGLALIPCFFAMWGALTSYRYFLDKPTDYEWFHYSLHGFFVAFAMIFYAWVTGAWIGFGIRCVLTGLFVGGWSHITEWDDLEEFGRGFIIAATVPLLFLPF